jgi:hypothetical protein
MSRRFAMLVVAALAFPAALAAKPPWISIELPANPWDQATRGAFLVVHTYHYTNPTAGTLTGRAVGIVNGVRRSVPLTFAQAGRPGDFALQNQWGDAGRWILIITVSQGSTDNLAQALVQIAEHGTVTGVRVPTRREGDMTMPRALTDAEIQLALAGN